MFIPTIGLEIHAELKTASKMFCSCKNDPDKKKPNINVCPICLAHPGPLPTINKLAVISVIRLGLAIGGTIAPKSHFDRKSYFYPDLPKGYQISQYENPLVSGGILKGIRITRVHLEEDTGKLIHSDDNSSLVDYNRAGIPLMELVTEPDIKNAEEAVAFARELQLILRYLEISDADMEKGQMRVEANISVRKLEEDEFGLKQSDKLSGRAGSSKPVLGTKVEVKNLNSFEAVYNAIEYELKRQERHILEGENVKQETRGWNDKKRITESQRSKESAHDYRYFSEPDLPEITTDYFDLEKIKLSIPELPEEKRHRLTREYGVSRKNVELLIGDKQMADYFEHAMSELKERVKEGNTQTLFNYLTSDIRGLMNVKNIRFSEIKISPEHFAHLIALISDGKLSSRLAKNLLLKMFETGEDPETLARDGGVRVISNEDELLAVVKEVLQAQTKVVDDYKKGKTNALQFLIGQGMAKTKGKADPDVLRGLFEKQLK